MPRNASTRKQETAGFADAERSFDHEDILRGIKARRVKSLIDRGVLSAKQVYRIVPERTFNRRLASGQALKPGESDAIARLLRIIGTARKTFGDTEFADKWLSLPNPVLKDRIPIELAETDAGAREVEGALLHFAYGDYL
jgi:putative toxin-antitoxin system antitoxin component (TIGR02293 family)